MDGTNTQSLSRGVFTFRGKKKKPSICDYVQNSCGLKELQLSHYNYLSSQLDDMAENIHADVADDLFSNLISYITECGQKRSIDEIHAAALITGVNTPDHDVLYGNVVTHIKEQVTPYVVLLESHSKATSLKHLLHKIASDLKCTGGSDEAGELSSTQSTLYHIENWYKSVEKVAQSPKKTKRARLLQPRPIVLVFEEFSRFPIKCMQDLLISFRNHLESIPIVLVFGVSLSLSALRSTLTHELSTLLSIQAFQMISSSVYLNAIIDKMLIASPLPFRLDGRTFQLLLDNFLCHDFSIKKFLCSLKFCLMEHCLGNTEAISALSRNSIPKMDLDCIRRLSSFRRYVESESDPSLQIKLLEDDGYTRKTISSLIKNINTFHQKQPALLRCLHNLVKDLPASGFGKQVREVYFTVLSEGLTDKLKGVFDLIKNLSKVELESQLEFIIETMTSSTDAVDISTLQQALYKLQHFEELLAETEVSQTQQGKKSLFDKKMDMYTLRKTLQGNRPHRVTLYEQIRSEASDTLYTFFSAELEHHRQLPLYELFYYENIKSLKAAINAMPRVAVFSALSKPNMYIDAIGPLPSIESVTPRLPDTSLAFKLHLECGALINVYDWMQAFLAIHEGDSSHTVDNKELCARFTHSTAEMQFLGFVKSTKKKTDHMSRLTWGTV
ncbi:origin recognition complex subunit 3-like [Watersipora subatra]|uniref:origin recognition complex subunit 3-like n=1 Tax=Watersipora subatra TaxID=2589382 RepID=UPI00355C3BC6